MTDSFIARFGLVASRFPLAEAIVERGSSAVCYGELWERTVALGTRLMQLGVGPEQVVALAMPKSTDYVVGMLGCWFAGAAFLSLDPRLPEARRLLYLTQARVSFSIISEHRTSAPLGTIGIEVAASPASPSARFEPAQYDPESLAYVIFTSGSSGAPKGVLVSHRGVLPMLEAQISAFDLKPGDRSLWLLSTAFDASVSDVGTALLAGASLHIESESLSREPNLLLDVIRTRAINYVDLPPALLPHLDETAAPPCLKTIVVGGEPCDARAARRWARRVRLINVYGPTEATVCTSLGVCDPETWDRPLLGAELPGVQYLVCGPTGVPCAAGEAGELFISGLCLARGYLGLAELTASRFIMRDGVRFFRTGDRVLCTADGELEFMGRIDRQLKIRGALVAPEEIEAQLMTHPAVRRAAVVLSQAASGPSLSAWLEGSGVSNTELSSFLATRLPAYMIPARFEWLPELPTTASGKPDLARLVDRYAHSQPHRPRGAPPASADELRIAELFRRMFGVDAGLEDDFFSLGGDSIKLIELSALAERAGLPITAAVVLREPTVAGLAAHLASGVDGCDAMPAQELRALVDGELAIIGGAYRGGGPACDAIFVTGATGFLGARIVRELLLNTTDQVLCLVRAPDEETGRTRVLSAITAQGLEVQRNQETRIVPVLGDLSRHLLGLPREAFEALSMRAKCVFHCGAQVSLMADRHVLWPTNVCGTREILRLVATGVPKALHYTSTLSVFVSADRREGTFLEVDELEHTQTVYGGYAQTKWAAEAMVRAFGPRGRPLHIYRLGLLTGDSETGRGAARDWLALTVRGLADLGRLPSGFDPDLAMDVTPVDYAARAMVGIALSAPAVAQLETLHLAGRRAARLSELATALRDCGRALREVDSDCWQAAVDALLASRPGPELSAACLALRRALSNRAHCRVLDLFQATRCHFDDQRTRTLLDPLGIECPALTPTLLNRYVHDILDRPGVTRHE